MRFGESFVGYLEEERDGQTPTLISSHFNLTMPDHGPGPMQNSSMDGRFCPFCRSFAATSALRGELPGRRSWHGRAIPALVSSLKNNGAYDLAAGAVLIEGSAAGMARKP